MGQGQPEHKGDLLPLLRAEIKNVELPPHNLYTFWTLRTLKLQVKVLWVVTSCGGAVGYRCCRAPCYLHLQGCDAMCWYGRISTLWSTLLPPFPLWQWRQKFPLKCWYPTATIH